MRRQRRAQRPRSGATAAGCAHSASQDTPRAAGRRRRVAEAGETSELVGRVVAQPQQREQVLDVGRVEVAQAPYLTNGMPRRVSSSSSRAESWPVRNRTAWARSSIASSRAASTRSHTSLAWRFRRGGTRAPAARRPRAHSTAAWESRRGPGPRRRSRPRGSARGAVVALEQHSVGVGEQVGEVEDVAGARGTEAVDRLEVVADDPQAPAPATQSPTMSTCSAFTSWYSSTSTCSKPPAIALRSTPRPSAPASPAAGRRGRARPARACGRRRPRTPRERARRAPRTTGSTRRAPPQRQLGVDHPRVDVEHRARPREPPGAGRAPPLRATSPAGRRRRRRRARRSPRPSPSAQACRRTKRWASEWKVPPTIAARSGARRAAGRGRAPPARAPPGA